MKYDEAEEQIQAIADRCENEADVIREIARLSPDDKFKMIHNIAKEEAYEEIQRYSLGTIDFLDKHQLVNDYSTGVSRREPMLGILASVARIYSQSTEDQGRRELQTQTEHSQHATELTTYATDLSSALVKIVYEIISIEMEYVAVLKGRRFGVHYTDDEGTHVPYSAEEVARETEIYNQREEDQKQYLEHVRQVHEDNYWGRGQLPEIEAGGLAQTILPLWSVGYTPEQK